MKIKIICYNILTGFYDDKRKGKKGKFVHNIQRQRAAKELIEKENPDILILTEICWLKKNFLKIKQNYKKIFDYKYRIFGSDVPFENVDWGVGILSRFPIIKSEDYTTKHSRFVRALIKIKNKTVMIDAVHPDPYHNEHQRMQWFKTVIRDRKDPYILGGDFNAFSKSDNYNKRKLIEVFSGIYKPEEKYKAKNLVNDILTGKTINFLLKSNLVDTFKVKNKKFDSTFPTKFLKSKSFPHRIDYIFCSNDLKVLNSGIIKNRLTEKASDHYPIYAILEI